MAVQAMRDGAYGLSSGLKYIPGAYAQTEEVIELARVAGAHGGIYITHMREEGLGLLDSIRETIRIGEEGGLPAQVTHHKVMGASMWGQSVESLALLDAAFPPDAPPGLAAARCPAAACRRRGHRAQQLLWHG